LLTQVLLDVERWDDGVSRWVAEQRTPTLDTVAHWGTFVADTTGIAVVAVTVTAVLLVRRAGRLIALVPCGLLLELASFGTTNYAVRRPRPQVPHLGATPSTWSFPSGHCAAAVVLYGSIALIVVVLVGNLVARLAAVGAALLVPLWVAFSRVYAGQHHLLDVVAGLGMGLGALVAAALTTVPATVRPARNGFPVEQCRGARRLGLAAARGGLESPREPIGADGRVGADG
jgi:undecaprenyl-diphosphatase